MPFVKGQSGNPETMFKPGQVSNPKGRGKDIPNTKTRLKRLLTIMQDIENPITGEREGFTVAEQMDLQQVLKALKGNQRSFELLMDRLEGKPTVDISSKDGTMTPTVIIGDSYSGEPKFRPDNKDA